MRIAVRYKGVQAPDPRQTAPPGEPSLADRADPAGDARQAFDRLAASLDAIRFVLDAAAVAAAEASTAAKGMVCFD